MYALNACLRHPRTHHAHVHECTDLPKQYPHQLMRIDVAATKEPLISFSSEKGIQLQVCVCVFLFWERGRGLSVLSGEGGDVFAPVVCVWTNTSVNGCCDCFLKRTY